MRKKVFQGLLAAAIGVAFVLQGGCGGAAKQPSLPTAPTTTSQSSSPQLTITVVTLPDAALGSTYASALHADGGSTPYTWKVAQGSLPDGLTLTQDGTLIGVPATAGVFEPTVQVSDASQKSISKKIGLRVAPDRLVIAATQLPDGQDGATYPTVSFSSSGGLAPISWGLASGQLPPGLKLTSDGQISGRATAAGTYSFTVRATDSYISPLTTTANFRLRIGDGKTPLISNVSYSTAQWSFTVSWDTDVPSAGIVQWGDNDGYGRATDWVDVLGETHHSITVQNRDPKNAVFIRIGSRGIVNGSPDPSLVSYQNVARAVMPSWSTDAAHYDFVTYAYGPHRAIGGYDLYYMLRFAPLALTGIGIGNAINVQLVGLPAGATATCGDANISEWFPQQFSGTLTYKSATGVCTHSGVHDHMQEMIWKVTLPANVPPGNYTLTFAATNSGDTAPVTRTVLYPLTIDPQNTVSLAAPQTYPAIPYLKDWERNMITYGTGGYCQGRSNYVKDAGVLAPPNGDFSEQYVWYYDGGRVYYQIEDYDRAHNLSGNPDQFEACIPGIQWRDFVLSKSPVGNVGKAWWGFAEGLYLRSERTGDTSSVTALQGLATNLPYTRANGQMMSSLINDNNQREMTYKIDILRFALKTDPTNVYYQRNLQAAVAANVGHLYNLPNEEWIQPFMIGLKMEALIRYYEDGHQDDLRIPAVINFATDWMWKNLWLATGGDSWVQQCRTDYVPGCFPYNSRWYATGIGTGIPQGGTDMRNLNLMLAPAWAWMFKMTGDTTYQQQGDAIWSAGVEFNPSGTLGWSGKNFSQQYRWSFDYVKWRTAP